MNKVKKIFTNYQEKKGFQSDYIPNSVTFTKLELPVLYSNLVLIEDMKFENSNYFLRANGFTSKKIKLSSITDPNFELFNCVFRIYPRTYNINKYKVLEQINAIEKNQPLKKTEEQIHFKFSAEMFNNLDIVQNKFAEPIRYGDIVMLMHENSKMFVKYVSSTKKLTLSNHDSDLTLFSVEPASEIMLNDDQILKTGQPVKFKIACFIYANDNLYIGTRISTSIDQEDNPNLRKGITTRNAETNYNKKNSKGENSPEKSPDKKDKEHFLVRKSLFQVRNKENEVIFDNVRKKYTFEPDIVIEENSNMKWRLNLYSPFTSNENLIIYGDLFQIYHCLTDSYLSIGNIQEVQPEKNEAKPGHKLQESTFSKYNSENTENKNDYDISLDLNDSGMDLLNEKSFSDIDNDELIETNNNPINVDFFMKKNENSVEFLDVNSTWTIENIFPLMKKQSFVRFIDETKLDTYRMAFRIKNFKTGKFLSIKEINFNDDNVYLKRKTDEELYSLGYLRGSGDLNKIKIYQFCLIDSFDKQQLSDKRVSTEDYQYSLFAFKRYIKSKTFYSQRPECNDFLRIFHISSQSYLKFIPMEKQRSKKISGNVSGLVPCILTLTKFPEESEVFKMCPVDPFSQWKFRFLNSIYSLLQGVTQSIKEADTEDKTSIPLKSIQMTSFILDKLLKFTLNKFINKFSPECGFNTVVKNRQILISNFGFSFAFFIRFIYNFWIRDDPYLSKLIKLNNLLSKITSNEEAMKNINNIDSEKKLLYLMYKYTESIFAFSIVYCKDNNIIQEELYEYLNVYFYFFNIIESCLFGMIEIFKDNEKILHSIKRDCYRKPHFKMALQLINENFFTKATKIEIRESEVNDLNPYLKGLLLQDNSEQQKTTQISTIREEVKDQINIFELIFKYIKISSYQPEIQNFNHPRLNDDQFDYHNTVSLITREKYFDLLISLVYMKNGQNILENQRTIIDLLIESERGNEDKFIFHKYIVNRITLKDDPLSSDVQYVYPPCLKRLVFNMALDNPDDKIFKFLEQNINLKSLFKTDSESNVNDFKFQELSKLSADIGLMIYFINYYYKINKSLDKEDLTIKDELRSDIKKYFQKKLRDTIYSQFYQDKIWNINFLNQSEVNLVISALKLLQAAFENDILNSKEERDFISNLMKFLTRNYKKYKELQQSNSLHGDMKIKQTIINERITKCEHVNYIAIAESWLRVFLVYKYILTSSIEKNEQGTEEIKTKALSTVKKNIMYKGSTTFGNYRKKTRTKSLLPNERMNTLSKRQSTTIKKYAKFGKATTRVFNMGDRNRGKFDDPLFANRIITEEYYDAKDLEGYFEIDEKTLAGLSEKTRKILERRMKSHNLSSNSLNGARSRGSRGSSVRLSGKLQRRMTKGVNPSRLDDAFGEEAEEYEDIAKLITSEDEKMHSKSEISKNIIQIFQLIIKKNVKILLENFYDYYTLRGNENNVENINFDFEDFYTNCLPNLDSGSFSINRMIDLYCGDKFKSELPCINQISNFNLEFVDSTDRSLNFIQFIIEAFNITEDLEMQESLLGLIKSYFSQRKKFFKKIIQFNKRITAMRAMKNNPFNDRAKIKKDFKNFFQNYEKNKHKYSNESLELMEDFFEFLMTNLLTILRKILNFWKYEFRTLSLENAISYYNNIDQNENFIKDIEKMISIINTYLGSIEKGQFEFGKKEYITFIEEIIKIFYFARDNQSNYIFASLLSILTESEGGFSKMFFSMISDFLLKGKSLIDTCTDEKENENNLGNNIVNNMFNLQERNEEKNKKLKARNKFFACFFMLLVFQYISLPKTDKAVIFLRRILSTEKDMLKYDSFTKFLILLFISDIEKENFSLKYSQIVEQMKTMFLEECFSDYYYRVDFGEYLPLSFRNLCLEIITNVLKFVVSRGKIISEAVFDEIVVDNVLYLLKRTNLQDFEFSKKDCIDAEDDFSEKISFIIKVVRSINTIYHMDNLRKILQVKIDPDRKTNFDNELKQFFNNALQKALVLFKYDFMNGGRIKTNIRNSVTNKLKNEQKEKTENQTNEEPTMTKQIIPKDPTSTHNYSFNTFALDDNNEKKIKLFFPQPHQLMPLLNYHYSNIFDKNIKEDKCLFSHKQIYQLTHYFIFYIIAIDKAYFNLTADGRLAEFQESYKKKELYDYLKYISEGEYKADKNQIEKPKDEIFYLFLDNKKKEREKFPKTSFFYLLNTYINKLNPFNTLEGVDFGQNCEEKEDITIQHVESNPGNDDSQIYKYNLPQGFSTDEHLKEDFEKGNEKGNNNLAVEDDLSDLVEEQNNKFSRLHKNFDKVNYYIYKKQKDESSLMKNDYEDYKKYKENANRPENDKLYKFKSMLLEHKTELYDLMYHEKKSIVFYLIDLLNETTTGPPHENIFVTYVNKIVDFIEKKAFRQLETKTVKLINYQLFIVTEIIKFFEENEDKLVNSNLNKKTLREIQSLVEKTGLIGCCLDLVRRYDNPEISLLLPGIFDMFCMVLKKGNYNSQENFYNLFITKTKYEPVFYFMLDLMSSKMNIILSKKIKILRHKKKKTSLENKLILDDDDELDSKMLQFLQLLCENHNAKLQLFLNNQSNFKKSYNLVLETQHYLSILFDNFEPFLFEPLLKCFDLLIEFIQGPCVENQTALIKSKLLITIKDILQYYLHSEMDNFAQEYPMVKEPKNEDKMKVKRPTNIDDFFDDKERAKSDQESRYETNFKKMSAQQISLLTFKCSILLLALVENRTKDDPIYGPINTIIGRDFLKSLWIKIYFEYLMLINETNELDDYSLKLKYFGKDADVEETINEQIEKNEKFLGDTDVGEYLILESGFFFYFLDLYLKDYLNHEPEKRKDLTIKQRIFNYFKGTVVESFIVFIINLCIDILATIGYFGSLVLYCITFGGFKKLNLLRAVIKWKTYKGEDSFYFYQKYTQSIEVLRNDQVFKVYFYVLPYCKTLNKFEKIQFLEEIDRSNSKTKLMDILKYANTLKFELESDYKVKQFALKIPILGVIFKSVELWKDLSLMLNIIQNCFSIFGVHKVAKPSPVLFGMDADGNPIWDVVVGFEDEKTILDMDPDDFADIIKILSIIQCLLACLIVLEYFFRKAPAIWKMAKEEAATRKVTESTSSPCFLIFMGKMFTFETIYYILYAGVAFLGTFASDFFFAFLLLEVVMRFKTLRNVLMAIKNPYKELALTLIMWLIIIYYFAIFGYSFLRESEYKYYRQSTTGKHEVYNFPNSYDCSSLTRCVAVLFYQNNKQDNGIGSYFNPIVDIYDRDNVQMPFIGRFWYDELFNLILKVLIVQMISGIIIDNFTVLREKETEMLLDMKNNCTICSLKRDAIAKIYDKHGYDYTAHIEKDHKIFNYIYYIIYLYKKDVTEFTGIESYVYELTFNQKDITWFPTKRLYIAAPGEIIEEEEEEEEDED